MFAGNVCDDFGGSRVVADMDGSALLPLTADSYTSRDATEIVDCSAAIRRLAFDLLAWADASWSAAFIANGETLLPFTKFGDAPDLEAAEWAGARPQRGEFVMEIAVDEDNPGASYLPRVLGLVWIRSEVAGMVALGPPKNGHRYTTDVVALIAAAARRASSIGGRASARAGLQSRC